MCRFFATLPKVAHFATIVKSVRHKVPPGIIQPTPCFLRPVFEKWPGETHWRCATIPWLLGQSTTLLQFYGRSRKIHSEKREEENGFCAIRCLWFGVHCYQLKCLTSLQCEKFISSLNGTTIVNLVAQMSFFYESTLFIKCSQCWFISSKVTKLCYEKYLVL